mmetsp:Transcript_24929/g.48771  ORF Transcript_24929/g.48771 Transcript_24929/m.48771 type:complete len:561 (-) Transcript_24929:96-1778(-)
MGKRKGKRKVQALNTFGAQNQAKLAGERKKKKKKKGKNPSSALSSVKDEKERSTSSKRTNTGSSNGTKKIHSLGTKLLSSSDPNRADQFFAWLIDPVKPSDFAKEYFEKKHLLIQRAGKKGQGEGDHAKPGDDQDAKERADAEDEDDRHYYSGFYGSSDIKAILENEDLKITYGQDIDITKFAGGKRKTLNKEGQAEPEHVWRKFENGCSVRVLRPQEYSDNVCGMLSLMDEYWGRVSGANAYLTPANTQGFAPHYDDVDVYILQLEGRKRWRLYPARGPDDVLPLYSSQDLDPKELPEPMLDTVLSPGDLLYAPRGTIHQAVALPGGPASLHLTISSGQRWTFSDYMALLLPRAVDLAAESDAAFRASLPRNFQDYMGVIHVDKTKLAKKRVAFRDLIFGLAKKLITEDYFALDGAADQMARDFIHGRVPPLLPKAVRKRLAEAKRNNDDGRDSSAGQESAGQLTETMHIALVAKGCARLVMEGEAAMLYFSTTNSKVFKGEEEQSLPFADHCAPALEQILDAYPRFVRIGDLEQLEKEEQLVVANVLFQAGLVVAKHG